MSRKNKVGIDYFSHDVDMKDDKKIRLIIAKHTLVGYGVYNRLLEEIYRESGYFVVVDSDFKVLFSDDCKMQDEEFQIILEDLILRGLFDKVLFDKFNILTSKRIQENYCSATERRKEVSFIADYLMISVDSLYNTDKVNVIINQLNVNINSEDVDIKPDNAGKSTQSKVKKIESKKKVKKIEKPENVSDQTWNDFLSHRKEKKAKVTQTVLNTFVIQSDLAGWTLENALKESMNRGWTGFKAEWVNKSTNQQNKPAPKQQQERTYTVEG